MDDLITHLPPTFVRWRDRLPWPSVAVTRRAMRLLVRIATAEFAAVAFDDVMRDLITRERVVLRVTQTTPTATRRWGCAFRRSAPPRQPVVLDQDPLEPNEWLAPLVMPERFIATRGCFRSTPTVTPATTFVAWDVMAIEAWVAAIGGDA